MQTRLYLPLLAATLVALSGAYGAETYKIDPAHSHVEFSVRHMGVSNVKGRFDDFAGSLTVDNGVIKEAQGTIQVKSINTGIEKRDEHLRNSDFFDVAKYPVITFKTKGMEASGDQTVLIADFTMHGVTKEIHLPVTVSGPVKDPFGGTRLGVEGKTTVSRKEHGMKFNAVMETGGLVVSDEVKIEINVEATKEVAGTK